MLGGDLFEPWSSATARGIGELIEELSQSKFTAVVIFGRHHLLTCLVGQKLAKSADGAEVPHAGGLWGYPEC
jgi:hypothetical protein